MRRKRGDPHQPRVRVKWSQDNAIELLASLDFVVQKLGHDTGRNRKEAVLRELQPRLEKHPRRTDIHIHNKLKSYNGVIAEVYRFGTSRMRNLNGSFRLMVQEKLKEIKREELSKGRQLRSASKPRDLESIGSKRDQTLFSPHTPTKSLWQTRQGNPRDRSSILANHRISPSKVRHLCENREQICAHVLTSQM
jgi:hypothetical protein